MDHNRPICSPSTAQALEFPALLAMTSQLAATDLGRQRILALGPLADPAHLAQRHRLLRETELALEDGPLVPLLEEPLAPLLSALDQGRADTTSGQEFLRLAEFLEATGRAARLFGDAPQRFPALAQKGLGLPSLQELLRRIRKTFDARGEVREDASRKLKSLRVGIRRQRDQLYGSLGSYVQDHRSQLADDTISLRGGRLSVLVPAGGHGRLGGLIHGRSASAKSYYFEPLEFVEPNNDLQRGVEEEEAERRRILAEIEEEVRRELPAIREHAEFLAALDLLQACCRLGEVGKARLVDLGPSQVLKLVEANHPLLDPRLADLRQAALSQAGHTGAVIPLDLELSEDGRALVVTGPNAGGKTVALKTLGLLVLAAQSGLPIPVGVGTQLPWVRRLVALVGDEQDLLADRSTFSARLLRLKEAWEAAGPESLILLDELGSGTNPDEGAALAIALLEGLVERGTWSLITTHLTQVASAALQLAGASCAAMEFDPETHKPTYRLLPGPPGGSEALALAYRLGLPAPWLARAEAHLGHEHRDLRLLLTEVEKLRRALASAKVLVEREMAQAEELRARLRAENEALVAERKGLAGRYRDQFDSFRRATQEGLQKEVDRLTRELELGRRRGLAAEAVNRLFADAPVPDTDDGSRPGSVAVGQTVRHAQQGWSGELEKLERGRAEVRVRGKKVRCQQGDLVLETAPQVSTTRRRPTLAQDHHDRPPAKEINLIGQRVEPALEALDVYLDRALLAGLPAVRVIHGHGSGRLREAVRRFLSSHPVVAKHEPAARNQGGEGATVAILREA